MLAEATFNLGIIGAGITFILGIAIVRKYALSIMDKVAHYGATVENIMSQYGDVIKTLNASIQDGAVSQEESAQILKEVKEAIEATKSLLSKETPSDTETDNPTA